MAGKADIQRDKGIGPTVEMRPLRHARQILARFHAPRNERPEDYLSDGLPVARTRVDTHDCGEKKAREFLLSIGTLDRHADTVGSPVVV